MVMPPGDNFTYSDGRTETVVSVSGEAVDWKNDLGFTFRSFRNPMLPRLAWQAETRRGETVLDAAPDLLWPLAPGTEAEFVARRAVIGNDGSRRDFVQSWRCRVEAAASIIVAAGRFDAWPLSCERRDEIGAVRERRSSWYAPAIGHVVKLEEDRDGLTTRRELVAYFKFESNHSGEVGADPAQSAFQQAMERVMTGFELTWRSEDGARSITY